MRRVTGAGRLGKQRGEITALAHSGDVAGHVWDSGGERLSVEFRTCDEYGLVRGLAPPVAFLLRPLCCACCIHLSLYQHHNEGFKVRTASVIGGDIIWCCASPKRGLSKGCGGGEREMEWNVGGTGEQREAYSCACGKHYKCGGHRSRVRLPRETGERWTRWNGRRGETVGDNTRTNLLKSFKNIERSVPQPDIVWQCPERTLRMWHRACGDANSSAADSGLVPELGSAPNRRGSGCLAPGGELIVRPPRQQKPPRQLRGRLRFCFSTCAKYIGVFSF